MVKLGKTQLDVSIDGADAVDPGLCLFKGGGGALLREKMVGILSKKFICIVDETSLCPPSPCLSRSRNSATNILCVW